MQGSFYPFQQYIDDLSKVQDGTYKMYPSKYLIAPHTPSNTTMFLRAINEQMQAASYKDKRNNSASKIVQELAPNMNDKFVGTDINFIGTDVFDGKAYFETYLHFPQPSQMVAYSAMQTYENRWKNQVIYSYEPIGDTAALQLTPEYQQDDWDPDHIKFLEWIRLDGSGTSLFVKYPQMYAYTRHKQDNGEWGELTCISKTDDTDNPIWTLPDAWTGASHRIEYQFYYQFVDNWDAAEQATNDISDQVAGVELDNELGEGWMPSRWWASAGTEILNTTNKNYIVFFGIYSLDGGQWKYIRDVQETNTSGNVVTYKPLVQCSMVSGNVSVKIGQAKPTNVNDLGSGFSIRTTSTTTIFSLNLLNNKYPNSQYQLSNISGGQAANFGTKFYNTFSTIYRMTDGVQQFVLYYHPSSSSVPTNPATDPTRNPSSGSYTLDGWSQEPGGSSSRALLTWATQEHPYVELAIYDVRNIESSAWIGGNFPMSIAQREAVNGFADADLPADRSLFTNPVELPNPIPVNAVVLFYNLYTTGGTTVCLDMPLGLYVPSGTPITITEGESWSTRIATRFAYSGSIGSTTISTSGNTFNTLQRVLEGFGDAIEKMNSMAISNNAAIDINDFKSTIDTIRRSGSVNVPYLVGNTWYVNGRPAKNIIDE